MENTQGFYSKENDQILFAPNGVDGQTFNLMVEDKDTYTYPVGGWYWFDSEEEAIIFFNQPVPEMTPAEYITIKVQEHLDNTAKTKGYDDILSLCTYVNDPDPIFAAQGEAGVVWRSGVWRTCYNIMEDVQQGLRPIPTVEEILLDLPVIQW